MSLALRKDISQVIRQVQPTRVVCMSPEREWTCGSYACHPDHLAAGEAALCAVYPDARNPFAHPSLLDRRGAGGVDGGGGVADGRQSNT